MKHFKIINIFIILLILSSCQLNKTEEENDAIFKSIKKIYELKEDGTIIYHYQHKLKYITHLSFNRAYGESFIVYNPNFQELKINKAETTMTDGKIVPSPENAFNEVLPRFAAGVPDYNHLREMVVTHTGLELGCVVDFDYEVHSKAAYLPFLNENILLQERVPVENLEIIVKVPSGIELNYKLLNSNSKAEIEEKEGYKMYSWTFYDLDGTTYERNQPHDQSFAPRLLFSNVNMAQALETLVNKQKDPLSNQMKGFVKKSISEKDKEIQIIRELQKLVHHDLNEIHIPIEYSAFSTRTLQDVWNSNSGKSIEKIVLLNEFIKNASLSSEIIYALPADYYDENLGVINETGHFYILTTIDEEETIISTDPHQSNNLALNLKNSVLLNMDGKPLSLPILETEINSEFSAKGEFSLSESGDLSGKLNITLKGLKNPYLDFLEDAKSAKQIIKSVSPGNSIEDFEVVKFDQNESETQAEIKLNEIWKNQDNYYFLTLPASNYGIKGEHLPNMYQDRKTPLQLSECINEMYKFSIQLPDSITFVAPEITKGLTNTIGEVKISIAIENQTVQILKQLKINESTITPEKYADFKALIDIWNKKQYNEIVLKK